LGEDVRTVVVMFRRVVLVHIVASLLVLSGCFPEAKAPAGDEPASKLRLASTDWPPFTDVEGKPRVATELVTTALEKEGVSAETLIVPIDSWLESIQSGKFEGSVAVWKSDERQKFLLFSKPYLENRLVLIGLSGADYSATSFAMLDGKRVGVVEGYAYGEELDQASGVTVVKGESTSENIRAVLDGKLDYALADALLAHHVLAGHPNKDKLAVGDNALISRTLHFAVRKNLPGAKSIIERFNGRIGDMIASGAYNRILGVQWVRADADGDGKDDLISASQAGETAPQSSYELVKSKSSGPNLEFGGGYFVNGERYDTWESVPDNYKIAPTRVDAGVKLLEF
jgi:polar amino acid transport system substrate-binding protein